MRLLTELSLYPQLTATSSSSFPHQKIRLCETTSSSQALRSNDSTVTTANMCHIETTRHANCVKPDERRHNPPMIIDQSRLGPFQDGREGWVPCQLVLDFQRTHNQCLGLHPEGFPITYKEEDIDCKECNYVTRERHHWVTFESAVRVKAEACIESWHQSWDQYKVLPVPCSYCINGKFGLLPGGSDEPKNPPTPEFRRVTPRTGETAAKPPPSWGPFFS